ASYFVEGAAARALGQTRTAGAFDALVAASERPSWNEVIREGVFQGLAALGDPRAAPVLVGWLDRAKPIQARAAAARALGALASDHRLDSGEARQQMVQGLLGALDDPWPPVRGSAARALGSMRESGALEALDQMASRELDGIFVRAARLAARDIREGKQPADEVRQLRNDFDAMKEENRKLRERLEALAARLENGQER
ncbi:MAG TPA: HEAT repeat domain-containing protein, partial [Ktedonobacterales bacterium]